MEPIRLRWSNVLAEARRNVEVAGRGLHLRRTKVMAEARRNVEKAKLQREAEQAGRQALAAVWRALVAYDRARGLTPSGSERTVRTQTEALLKKIAGMQ